MSLLGKIVKLPWWLVSKGVIGGVGTILAGAGLIKTGKVIEGIGAVSVGVGMIGQRHAEEKTKRSVEEAAKK